MLDKIKKKELFLDVCTTYSTVHRAFFVHAFLYDVSILSFPLCALLLISCRRRLRRLDGRGLGRDPPPGAEHRRVRHQGRGGRPRHLPEVQGQDLRDREEGLQEGPVAQEVLQLRKVPPPAGCHTQLLLRRTGRGALLQGTATMYVLVDHSGT